MNGVMAGLRLAGWTVVALAILLVSIVVGTLLGSVLALWLADRGWV